MSAVPPATQLAAYQQQKADLIKQLAQINGKIIELTDPTLQGTPGLTVATLKTIMASASMTDDTILEVAFGWLQSVDKDTNGPWVILHNADPFVLDADDADGSARQFLVLS